MNGKYMTYVVSVRAAKQSYVAGKGRLDDTCNEDSSLWRQLILTCNNFCVKLVDQKKYHKAMEMLEKANELINKNETLTLQAIDELTRMVLLGGAKQVLHYNIFLLQYQGIF